MRKFNLEKAKAGDLVCTKSGRAVRIICFDAKGSLPVVALIEEDMTGYHTPGIYENAYSFHADGTNASSRPFEYDLMMRD